jgi:hypothetical protein
MDLPSARLLKEMEKKPMSEKPDIVVLERAKSSAVASLIVQALKFEGIPAYVGGCLLQDPIAMFEKSLGTSCVDIQVPRSCLDEARKVLETMREAGKLLKEVEEED